MKKIKIKKIKTNKPVYLGLSMLGTRKALMSEFWYDYIKPKHQQMQKIETDSFIIYVKTEDVYEDIADDVEKRFDTWNDEFNRPLSRGKNKKVTEFMKDELRGKIIT